MNYQEFHSEIDATYTELRSRTNELAHKMAMLARGQEYIDQVILDPSKKFVICPDDYRYASRPRFSGPSTYSDPNENKLASPVGEHGTEFTQHTTKVKARARALAELKLEEMDVREQHIQLKFERIQAKRELLELDTDEA
jgi:hypothetical protein